MEVADNQTFRVLPATQLNYPAKESSYTVIPYLVQIPPNVEITIANTFRRLAADRKLWRLTIAAMVLAESLRLIQCRWCGAQLGWRRLYYWTPFT